MYEILYNMAELRLSEREALDAVRQPQGDSTVSDLTAKLTKEGVIADHSKAGGVKSHNVAGSRMQKAEHFLHDLLTMRKAYTTLK